MKKLLSLLTALAMACTMTVAVSAEETAAAAEELAGSIVILHTNDVHGGIAGYARVAALKQSYEEKGAYVLLLDAGDYIQGDPAVSVSQGATAIGLMNLAGYDAAALGNHEFDYGYENLVELSKQASFPILSANTLYDGKVAFGDHKVFTAPDGTKIGVFGLETPETATKAHPGKIRGVTFLNGEALFRCAQAQVDTLRAAGCDYVVCLGHLGIDVESVGSRSIDLLEQVSGIDIFIDGHSHSTIEEVRAAADGHDISTILTSTGTKLSSIGVITIATDGRITAECLAADSLTIVDDETVAARAAAIQKQIDDDYGAVFASSEYTLNGAKAPNGNRDSETNLGDLITDAMVWGAQQNGEAVDAAIINGGGIRATIPAGNITKKDINTVLPFGNTLNIVKITGAELLEVLEASTYCTPEAVGGFPQTSGIQWTLDTTKTFDADDFYPGSTYSAPKSINRVTIQTVGDRAFDKNAVYSVATNDFLASGGDTCYAFSAASTNYDIGLPLDEILMDYIQTELKGVVGAAYAEPQNRMTLVAAAAEEPAEEPDETPAPMPTMKVELYTVVAGDCLWNIAYRYYGSGAKFSRIAAANGLSDPYLIYVGQTLTIPAA